MSDYKNNLWLVHFIYKLLQGNEGALSLLAENPFDDIPPTFILAELCEYGFASWDEDTEAWRRRKRLGIWLGSLSLEDPELEEFLQHYGWGQQRYYDLLHRIIRVDITVCCGRQNCGSKR